MQRPLCRLAASTMVAQHCTTATSIGNCRGPVSLIKVFTILKTAIPFSSINYRPDDSQTPLMCSQINLGSLRFQ